MTFDIVSTSMAPECNKQSIDRENVRKDDGNSEMARSSKSSNLTGGVFLATVAGLSIMGGFGMTIAMAKKKDPSMFQKGLLASREVPESGGLLAARALGWGTLYSVTGFSLLCFSVWKLMGVHSMKEFREKIQSAMPKVPKKESQGRTEFSSIRDLFEYLIDEDRRAGDKKR